MLTSRSQTNFERGQVLFHLGSRFILMASHEGSDQRSGASTGNPEVQGASNGPLFQAGVNRVKPVDESKWGVTPNAVRLLGMYPALISECDTCDEEVLTVVLIAYLLGIMPVMREDGAIPPHAQVARLTLEYMETDRLSDYVTRVNDLAVYFRTGSMPGTALNWTHPEKTWNTVSSRVLKAWEVIGVRESTVSYVFYARRVFILDRISPIMHDILLDRSLRDCD